jgi:membrane-bound serine protease (ClpP class)
MAPIVGVALPLLAVTTITTGAFAALIAWAAIRSRTIAATPGTAGAPFVLGSLGLVRQPIGYSGAVGSVYVAGEEWTARTSDGAEIERGVPVRVVGVDGLTLVVEPEASSSEPA